MAYALLDDGFHAHPKVVELMFTEDINPWEALGVWGVALSWACRYTIDKPADQQGVIPLKQVKAWDRMRSGALASAEALAAVGLWDRMPDGAYRIHDFRQWGRVEQREKAQRDGRKGAAKRWGHQDTLFDDPNSDPIKGANGHPTGGADGVATGGADGVATGGADGVATETPMTSDTKTDTDTDTKPKGQNLSAADAAEFDRFWAVYPRRDGKIPARTAWVKAVTGKKPHSGPTPPQVIIDGAIRYAESRRKPGFTAMPATWLNAGRWADELDDDTPSVIEMGPFT